MLFIGVDSMKYIAARHTRVFSGTDWYKSEP